MKKILAVTAAVAAAASAHSAFAQDYDWSGPYVGVYAGLNNAKTPTTDIDCNIDCDAPTVNKNAFAGGGVIGYNAQVDQNFVIGLEADFGTGASGVERYRYSGGAWNLAFASDINWNASVRARAGLAVNRTLVFVTGGLAIADANLSASAVHAASTDYAAQWSGTMTGFSAGGGVEHAITDNLTVKAEYLYSSFGKQSACFADTEGPDNGVCWNAGTNNSEDYADWHPTVHTLRIGANFKF